MLSVYDLRVFRDFAMLPFRFGQSKGREREHCREAYKFENATLYLSYVIHRFKCFLLHLQNNDSKDDRTINRSNWCCGI